MGLFGGGPHCRKIQNIKMGFIRAVDELVPLANVFYIFTLPMQLITTIRERRKQRYEGMAVLLGWEKELVAGWDYETNQVTCCTEVWVLRGRAYPDGDVLRLQWARNAKQAVKYSLYTHK